MELLPASTEYFGKLEEVFWRNSQSDDVLSEQAASDDHVEFNDSSVWQCRFGADSHQRFANEEELSGDTGTSLQ